jgi:hypothetical protein
MACTDAQEEFADTFGDLIALWVGICGFVLVTGLGGVMIGVSLVS